MATIEFITKRIEGKEKELAKLNKKLERILKAEETGWTVNPYYYTDSDKRWTIKDIEAAEAMLEKYKAELEAAQEKANSRNIEAIIKFLESWKERVTKFYADSLPKYRKAREEFNKYREEINRKIYNFRFNSPEYKAINEEYRKADKEFASKWNYLYKYLTKTGLDFEKLSKDLTDEANAMYDDIVERTNKITGKITDASQLTIGAKGDLNGYIIGEKGTAKVQTIGAGGYNIQCFHFRTLIHAVK